MVGITRVGSGGRVVIPAEYRRAMGVEPGDEVVMILEDEELRIVSVRHAVARAQALVRRYVARGDGLVGELLSDRRKDGKRE